jgi:RNA polymerase sigma-70 factor, ECF subfamily
VTPADRATFDRLLAEVLSPAYGLALSLSKNATEAEDLVQEAALAAFKGFRTFQPGTNFKAWFYRILTHCHYYRYRRTKSRGEAVPLEEDLDLYLYRRTAEAGFHAQSEDPAAVLLDKMTGEQIRSAVASLPPEFQVAVALFFLEEASYEEIAEVLEIPLGTVRSRLHRGRKLLQKALWQVAQEYGLVAAGAET